MRTVLYSDWKETSKTMHMILQMMGKVKTKTTPVRPERNVGALQLLAQGFSTGLIPNGKQSFDILLNMQQSNVSVHTLDGKHAEFSLRGVHSVAEHYQSFLSILQAAGIDADIDPEPTGSFDRFDRQNTKYMYDSDCAFDYYSTAVFVRNALLEFAAPFRGKKTLPALYWDSLRICTKLFSGEKDVAGDDTSEVPKGLNERYVEFGYYAGSDDVDASRVFIRPHSSADIDYSGVTIRPVEASYSSEQEEFYLDLEPVLRYPDPKQIIINFCRDAFEIISGTEGWKQMEWFVRPGR